VRVVRDGGAKAEGMLMRYFAGLGTALVLAVVGIAVPITVSAQVHAGPWVFVGFLAWTGIDFMLALLIGVLIMGRD